MESETAPQVFHLIGYLPCAEVGLALPCFGTTPGLPNTIHRAVADMPGQPLSRISAFERLEVPPAMVKPVPEPQAQLRVGDTWHDVFVWCGKPYGGTPAHIWDALATEREAIARDAPEALLDLAERVPGVQPQSLRQATFAAEERRAGQEAAAHWRDSLYLRRHLVMATAQVKQMAARAALEAAIFRAEIISSAEGVRLDVPANCVPVLNDYAGLLERATKHAMDGLGDASLLRAREQARHTSAPPFDLDEVYRIILRGQAPPPAWAPRITGLDLRGERAYRSEDDKKNFPRPELAYAALRDLAPLQALTNLQSLKLNNTQVADLAPLQALTNLQRLWLYNTQVADLAPLAGLKRCTVIMPDGTKMPAPEAARWKPKRPRRRQSSR